MSGQIVDSEALNHLSLDEVEQAHAEGRFSLLLDGVDIRRGEKLSPAQWVQALHSMSADEIAAAKAEGLLAPLEDAPASAADVDQGARGKRYSSLRDELGDLASGEILARFDRGDFDGLLRGDG